MSKDQYKIKFVREGETLSRNNFASLMNRFISESFAPDRTALHPARQRTSQSQRFARRRVYGQTHRDVDARTKKGTGARRTRRGSKVRSEGDRNENGDYGA